MKEFNLTEYLKDPSKKVVTRDGKSARIICTDYKSDYPIIGLVSIAVNKEIAYNFKENGRFYSTEVEESHLDLFFDITPNKKEGWVNVYSMGIKKARQCGNIFGTEKEALNFKGDKNYIATIKIEWEE